MAEQKKRTDMDRSYDRLKSLNGEIDHWIKHYARYGATFEFFLKWRDERIYGTEAWAKMQQWARTAVNHYFDYVFKTVDQYLVSTSVFKGQRLMHGHPALEAAREVYEENKLLEEQGKAAGCWCYAFCDTNNGNRLLLIPYREEDRAKEIASGRLTEEIIKSLYDPGIISLQRGNKLNGSPCLTLRVMVPVTNDGKVEMPTSMLPFN